MAGDEVDQAGGILQNAGSETAGEKWRFLADRDQISKIEVFAQLASHDLDELKQERWQGG
ncbi:hypothetical protein PTKU64_89610 [Paraburkholderia terrae]|uniref:Uncharacterized protein n=1 Tax=Paraburkholderia terrae TaxID=311230 RepID=A0ABM7U1Y0_9BURK|nr:hypothetical protein PTKU64_88720 [Paraburkholderia terrae]BCZ85286.1 hypothetical protein PTKU64_89610 [Paraburkholderia terrae]BDC45588.1 hypothetical protein PTKU15_88850 [Paraburkholderia terrae]